MKTIMFNKVWFIPLAILLMVALVVPLSVAAQNPGPVHQAAKFKLYILFDGSRQAECVSTGPWSSIDVNVSRRPGQAYFSDITVKGPFVSDRKAVIDWVNGAASGRRERVDMTLEFQDDKDQTQAVYILRGVLPLGYQPPNVSSGNDEILEETLALKPERLSPDTSPCQNTTKNRDDDKPLFGGKFEVEIDGVIENVTAVSGGGVTFDKQEITGGDHPGALRNWWRRRTYAITKANWQNIVLEKDYVKGDRKWEEWFKKTQNGEVEKRTITLSYHNSEGQPSGRGWTAYNVYPIRHDVINVDSRAGSSAIKEVMEVAVERIEYK